MAEYQKVEYYIGKDGKITEKVINGSGSSCLGVTAEIEQALGQIERQEFLPEYYEVDLLAEGDRYLEERTNG